MGKRSFATKHTVYAHGCSGGGEHSSGRRGAAAAEVVGLVEAVELQLKGLATDGFANQKKIGSGGFGRVYMAASDRLPLSALTESAPSTAL